jgi:hypothetical protein
VLFVALILLTVSYAMIYSALHGQWQFWKYFFAKTAPTAAAK